MNLINARTQYRTAASAATVALGLAALTAAVAPAGAATARTASACKSSALTVTAVGASPGVSHHGYVLRFHDTGATCTLKGYPTVVGLSAAGQPTFTAKRTKVGYLGGVNGAIPLVTLRSGRTVSALFEYIAAPVAGQSCAHATALQVTAPGATGPVHVAASGLSDDLICAAEIHPVVTGTSGGQ